MKFGSFEKEVSHPSSLGLRAAVRRPKAGETDTLRLKAPTTMNATGIAENTALVSRTILGFGWNWRVQTRSESS
ncbi:MAG: hypothetical protein CMJ64_00105 [Planctomycetaceae bacterium]|nr:hypothetical protein [Planctomycetaceae bacterium]